MCFLFFPSAVPVLPTVQGQAAEEDWRRNRDSETQHSNLGCSSGQSQLHCYLLIQRMIFCINFSLFTRHYYLSWNKGLFNADVMFNFHLDKCKWIKKNQTKLKGQNQTKLSCWEKFFFFIFFPGPERASLYGGQEQHQQTGKIEKFKK